MARKDDKLNEVRQVVRLLTDKKSMQLVAEMLSGNIIEIRPQLDFASELGFRYPSVEQILGAEGKETVAILESLVKEGILEKKFFERLLRCPQCQSVNLRPTIHCLKCGSGNVARGRIMEHLACNYIGLEEEFTSQGRLICPKCHQVLRAAESDYHNLGLLYKCRNCFEIFSVPQMKWRCLKCSSVTAEDKITQMDIYTYSLNESRRSLLEFELKPKPQLIEFLTQRGYKVTENAAIKGRSGATHQIDLLATRDDGIITYTLAIGIKVAGEKIELGEIFNFDDKAYDIGIHDKILIVVPELGREAEKYASLQKIKVLEVRDLETVLASGISESSPEIRNAPFEFKSKSQLIKYLKRYDYDVKENVKVMGKSGAAHRLDLLATKDDGIITHHMAIGIEVAEEPVALDKVFAFDDKAYDIGILDKAFIAVPGLTNEARQFAQRQRIKLFEVGELEPRPKPANKTPEASEAKPDSQ